MNSEPKLITLCDGEDPPARLINPDYKQQPGNSRKCVECGKTHDTIIEDMRTGDRIEEIDKCTDCLMSGCVFKWQTNQVELKSEYGGTATCMTSDGTNVNMAEELNRHESAPIIDMEHPNGNR